MRIKVKFKANETPIESVMNSHINGFVNKVLGENNKWHGKFSPYSVSGMYGGVLYDDKSFQYPNGGYFIVASSNAEFIGDFLKGLLSLDDDSKVLSMPFDGFEPYDIKPMSDYSIITLENVYLQKKEKNHKKEVYTFENCDDYLDKLLENSVKKLIKEGISERAAKSIKFSPHHPEKWNVKYCKYKMKDNHPLINKVSNIKLYVTGNKKARKMLFDMGVGNSTGFGFGFARLNEDNE